MTQRARRAARALAWSLVALASLSLSACGIPIDNETHAIPNHDVPFELLDASPATTTSTTTPPGSTTAQPERVYLYLVRNDRIERRERTVPVPIGVADRLAMLAAPLPAGDVDAGYRSAVAPGSFTTRAPQIRGGVAMVDLSPDFTSVPTKEQVLAFAQITYTLTDLPGIGQVVFTLDGGPINALDDEGVSISGPVTEDTYRDLFASS